MSGWFVIMGTEVWQQISFILIYVFLFLNAIKYVILFFHGEEILLIVDVFKKIQKS